MALSAGGAAAAARDRLRLQKWGLAIAVIDGDDEEFVFEYGDDEFDEHALFQIGSVTKTMTGLLVAEAVTRGEANLSTTVGDILGDEAGNCANLTLLALATENSGLPRLPPNLHMKVIDRRDPYAGYTESDLLEALRLVDPPSPKGGYSNFGFMLLGLLLNRLGRAKFEHLVKDRIFQPLAMTRTICGLPPEDQRVPGYEGVSQTSWWTTQLPGAGGISSSIRDIAIYIRAHLSPREPLKTSIELVLAEQAPAPPRAMGLGWMIQGGGHWHNGGTGGFRSFVALHSRTACGIALLANSHDAEALDIVGFSVLTDLVRSKDAG